MADRPTAAAWRPALPQRCYFNRESAGMMRPGSRVSRAAGAGTADYCAVKPPSITSSAPVMNADSSEARKSAA
jgi:hypothetical protein